MSTEDFEHLWKHLYDTFKDTNYGHHEPDNENRGNESSGSPKNIRYLGLNNSGQFGYHIGVDWICAPHAPETKSLNEHGIELHNDNSIVNDPAGIALVVTPKIANIDWLAMFMHCLLHPHISLAMQKQSCYAISTDRPPVPIKEDDALDVTPLLLIHYLSVLYRIARAGLKKGYVFRQKNLSSKIKGKVLLGKTITKNQCVGRDDRNYCRYQNYTIDCLENRILKRALDYTQRWLILKKVEVGKDGTQNLQKWSRYCQTAFAEVGSHVDMRSTERLRINPLYRDYAIALKLARTILRRFHYSFQEKAAVDIARQIPPFWIDMSKLFELYAYAKLYKRYGAKIIEYQVDGKYGCVDFLKKDEKMIIDTKYKQIYAEKEMSRYDINDIRQLSGYARDIKIRRHLGIDSPTTESQGASVDTPYVMPYCLILYPSDPGKKHKEVSSKVEEFPDNLAGSNEILPIKQFVRFYRCPLVVPVR